MFVGFYLLKVMLIMPSFGWDHLGLCIFRSYWEKH